MTRWLRAHLVLGIGLYATVVLTVCDWLCDRLEPSKEPDVGRSKTLRGDGV